MNAKPLERTVTSATLFAIHKQVLISHCGERYLLREAPNGGLLLTRWQDETPRLKFETPRKPVSGMPRKRHYGGLYGRIWLGDVDDSHS